MESSPPPQAAVKLNNQAPSAPSSPSPSSTFAQSRGPANATPGLIGKHRMTAAISVLNQQIQIIQDEIAQLETIDGVSVVCQELIPSVESIPDALLPVTRGPAEEGWDKWFQGAQSSRNRRRWI